MDVNGQLHTLTALPPRKESLVPTGQEAGWAPEPVWAWWWRKKFPVPAGTQTPDHPAHRIYTNLSFHVIGNTLCQDHCLRLYPLYVKLHSEWRVGKINSSTVCGNPLYFLVMRIIQHYCLFAIITFVTEETF